MQGCQTWAVQDLCFYVVADNTLRDASAVSLLTAAFQAAECCSQTKPCMPRLANPCSHLHAVAPTVGVERLAVLVRPLKALGDHVWAQCGEVWG